jgi:hypothetical protein
MKIKNQNITAQYWVGFPARGPALLAWLGGTVAQSAHASWCGTRTPGVVTVPRCSVVSSVSTRAVRGSRQGRRMVAQLTKGVERRRGGEWGGAMAFFEGGSAPASFGGSGGVLQLEEGTGEVRHGPKGMGNGGTVELSEGGRRMARRR